MKKTRMILPLPMLNQTLDWKSKLECGCCFIKYLFFVTWFGGWMMEDAMLFYCDGIGWEDSWIIVLDVTWEGGRQRASICSHVYHEVCRGSHSAYGMSLLLCHEAFLWFGDVLLLWLMNLVCLITSVVCRCLFVPLMINELLLLRLFWWTCK